MKFKILFPEGYHVKDYLNDNIDVRIALDNNQVFVATMITLQNIAYLMAKDRHHHFWCSDMVVVKDLKKKTIQSAVQEMITEGFLAIACLDIGTIQTVYDCYPQYQFFEDLPDLTHLY